MNQVKIISLQDRCLNRKFPACGESPTNVAKTPSYEDDELYQTMYLTIYNVPLLLKICFLLACCIGNIS